jgi:hypothetical protein
MTKREQISIPTALRSFLARQCYSSSPGIVFSESRSVLIAALVLFSAAFLARSWQNVTNPGLYMEDASHYFNLYYGVQREFSFILQRPNGYYNIINNLVAWITGHFDVRLQPLTYHLFALLMGIITATNLLFSGLLRNHSILLTVPIVLGLSGMNHIYYYNTLTFQMYNVVVVLLCLLFYPAPRSRSVGILQCLIAMLLIWSGPYSVVALPVSIMFLILFRNGSKTMLFVIVIINVILYSLSVRESTIRFYNILDEGIRRIATHVLFEKVFFLDLFGKLSLFKVLVFFFLFASVVYLLRKNVFYLKVSCLLFVIILSALAPLFLSVKFLLYQTVLPCHLYISIFFWLLFLLFTADQILLLVGSRYRLYLILPVLFFSVVLIDNIRHPAKGYREVMAKVPAFVQTIHQLEQLELAKDNTYVVVKTENVISNYMPPMVRVGSQRPDARRLGREDIKLESGKEFIVP